MSRFVVFILAATLAAAQGCSTLGMSNPFPGDPLTGGSEAATSRLLDVPLPQGMERYLSHGYQTYGAYGGREGLETLRGQVDPVRTAQNLHASLSAQGWQLRLSLCKGDRALHVYERGNAVASLSLRRQAVMTILEIWTGGRLPDGSMPNLVDGRDGQARLEGGASSAPPASGAVERWGGQSGGLQERPL